MDDYVDAMNDDMEKAFAAFKHDLSKIRTGRATPALIDGVQVNVPSYGAVMPINQLASIQAADARLLVVTPWDKGTLADVEKAILAADLGLNPSNDGKIIRVPVPPLTSERRQALVKQVRQAAEDAKVRVRHVRRDYNDIFKQGEKDGDVSQDDLHKLLDKVQASTDALVKRIDDAMAAKEAEVLEV